jgi:hypothetical protein
MPPAMERWDPNTTEGYRRVDNAADGSYHHGMPRRAHRGASLALAAAGILLTIPVLSGCRPARPMNVELVFRDLRSFPTRDDTRVDEWTAITRYVDFNDYHYKLRPSDPKDTASAVVVDTADQARDEVVVQTYVVSLRLRDSRGFDKIDRALDKARGRAFGPRGERIEIERVAARVLHESAYLRASLRYTVTGRVARDSDVFIVEGPGRYRWASAPRLEQWTVAVEPEPGTTELLAGAIRRDTSRVTYFVIDPTANTQRSISEDDFRARYRARFGEAFSLPKR